MRYSLVVFDVDGTLIDSARCISACVERALADCGFECDTARVKNQIGRPLGEIIRHVSCVDDETVIGDVIEGYRRHYAAIEHELIDLFPGTREALDALRHDGTTLAIATNKLTSRARGVMERFGLAGWFEAIVGVDQVAKAKPYPDIVLRVLELTGHGAAEALMVGDTSWDIEMAARAGVASCAVTWGNHDHAQLQGAGPTHVAHSFGDLRELLQTVAH